jgi:hypothetical protein
MVGVEAEGDTLAEAGGGDGPEVEVVDVTSVDVTKADDDEDEGVFGDGAETVVVYGDAEGLGELHTPPAAMNCSAFNDVPPTESRQ